MRAPFFSVPSLVLALGALTAGVRAQNLLPDGDFEAGIGSWTVEVPDPSAVTLLSSPGYTGNYAFEADFTAPATSPQLGVSARIIAPTLTLKPGQPYRFTFATFFDNADAGFVGVMVNDSVSVTGMTVDARDHHQWGSWYGYNGFTFTPAASTVNIKLEFLYGSVSSVDKVDNITLVAV
ncbi:hypothetical protein GQ53DRAFT_831760 [Thozetella sp. PMI_491]|nr:hypothetical protein GQ53DRAFT_831760 [Thozetella sp. PMI_491]